MQTVIYMIHWSSCAICTRILARPAPTHTSPEIRKTFLEYKRKKFECKSAKIGEDYTSYKAKTTFMSNKPARVHSTSLLRCWLCCRCPHIHTPHTILGLSNAFAMLHFLNKLAVKLSRTSSRACLEAPSNADTFIINVELSHSLEVQWAVGHQRNFLFNPFRRHL